MDIKEWATAPAAPVVNQIVHVPVSRAAFPCLDGDGLTKREYYAASFATSLLAGNNGRYDEEKTARNAVRMADMLIKELAK